MFRALLIPIILALAGLGMLNVGFGTYQDYQKLKTNPVEVTSQPISGSSALLTLALSVKVRSLLTTLME